MRIKNHRVEGLTFLPAAYTGEVITPEIVVLHDTAGALTKGNTATYLASRNSAEASVHFVIDVDGTITQLVATNRKANHAGASSFQGRSGCNAFSIGIELVNPGKMTRLSDTQALTWWGGQMAIGLYNIREAETKEHGKGLWMPHPEPQIAALIELLECLFAGVPTLTDITTHWYISPGRKIDPNPLLPLDAIRARVLGHDDPADTAAEAGSQVVPADRMVVVDLGPADDTLNLRRWPSFNPNVIGTIPDGTAVPVLRSGTFGGRAWLCVLYGGQEGWIVARYAADIISSDTAGI